MQEDEQSTVKANDQRKQTESGSGQQNAEDGGGQLLVWKPSQKTQNIASCQKLDDEKVKTNLF